MNKDNLTSSKSKEKEILNSDFKLKIISTPITKTDNVSVSISEKSIVDVNNLTMEGSVLKNGNLDEIIFQSHTQEKKDIFYDEMAYARGKDGSVDSSSSSYLKLR